MTKLVLQNLKTIDVPEWASVPGKYVAQMVFDPDEAASIRVAWTLDEHRITVVHGVLFKLEGAQLDKARALQYGQARLLHQEQELLVGPLWAIRQFSMPVQCLTFARLELQFRMLLPPVDRLTIKFFVVASESRTNGEGQALDRTVPTVQIFDDADEENELRAMQWRWGPGT